MTVKQIDSATLDVWVDALIGAGDVYGPQAKGDRFAFGPLETAKSLRLDYDVTILPPKKYFLPQREVLLKFDRRHGYESVFEDSPFVLLGVHPYDFAAISQLDQIFQQNNYDGHYMARREAAAVVVSDVENASDDVFAGFLGNATAHDREGADVLLTKLPDSTYVVESKTDKGEELLGPIVSAGDATADALAEREGVWERNRTLLRKHELRMAPERIPELLEDAYDHRVWKKKSELCYSCGSCNLVCPTCYCFDVQEDVGWDLQTGERTRIWDGCMLKYFAEVAGEHNFRPQKAARYRHRYYRKGKYVWDMIGEIACVGCGRCITACTSNIANPAEIFNTLLEEEER